MFIIIFIHIPPNNSIFGGDEPSHIHALYGEYVGVFDLNTYKMTDGDLPKKAQELVVEWLLIYGDILRHMWDTQNIGKLPPL